MKITVVGCGKTGTEVIERLCAEGHDVTVIEQDPVVLDECGNRFDISPVPGNGGALDRLSAADTGDCDFFVGLTGSDEINLISCFLARALGAKHTFARIRNPEYQNASLKYLREKLEITMTLNPEYESAEEIFDLLQFPSAFNIESFSRRHFKLVEIKLEENSVLDGVKLIDLRKNTKHKFLICAVRRGDKIFIPGGNFELKSGDKIGVTGTKAELTELLRSLGLLKKECKSAMILGGSRTAFYLAKMLSERTKCAVKIVDRNESRCNELAEALKGVTVICGNATSQELLTEEGIGSVDAMVSLTGLDEQNIMMAYYAGKQNVPKIVAKVNHKEFGEIARDIGIDSVISPQNILADIVVRNARAIESTLDSKLETLYELMDGTVEASEFSALSDFKFFNIPLKQMHLRKDVIVAGIIRNRDALIPTGDDCILPGDRVIIISHNLRATELSDIMADE